MQSLQKEKKLQETSLTVNKDWILSQTWRASCAVPEGSNQHAWTLLASKRTFAQRERTLVQRVDARRPVNERLSPSDGRSPSEHTFVAQRNITYGPSL
ncbi:hypothetical protein LR48_Vigan05g144800 [Vigna angularis]|uniref:Uncharacterized protein n=1 Tax=Phaseolus angularis TaxID=3914 RepID=A0A0L9UM56_PHAAN|nr:hypothetical protein LR48_Vigan05g144800 [Vigna angularis]